MAALIANESRHWIFRGNGLILPALLGVAVVLTPIVRDAAADVAVTIKPLFSLIPSIINCCHKAYQSSFTANDAIKNFEDIIDNLISIYSHHYHNRRHTFSPNCRELHNELRDQLPTIFANYLDDRMRITH